MVSLPANRSPHRLRGANHREGAACTVSHRLDRLLHLSPPGLVASRNRPWGSSSWRPTDSQLSFVSPMPCPPERFPPRQRSSRHRDSLPPWCSSAYVRPDSPSRCCSSEESVVLAPRFRRAALDALLGFPAPEPRAIETARHVLESFRAPSKRQHPRCRSRVRRARLTLGSPSGLRVTRGLDRSSFHTTVDEEEVRDESRTSQPREYPAWNTSPCASRPSTDVVPRTPRTPERARGHASRRLYERP